MTQIIDLTSNSQSLKKKIEFVSYLNSIDEKENIEKAENSPSEYNFIELICRNYINKMDIMLAYNKKDQREDGYLYFGHFNDGVV